MSDQNPDILFIDAPMRLRVLHWREPAAMRSGKAIVLLHGLGDGADVWRAVVDHIPKPIPCPIIAIDLPGHGGSGWLPSNQYTVSNFAEILNTALRHMGYDAVNVVGHSLGGCLAILMATHYPDFVNGLGLVDVNPYDLNDIDTSIQDHLTAIQGKHPDLDAITETLARRLPMGDRNVIRRVVPYLAQAAGSAQPGEVRLPSDPNIATFITERGRLRLMSMIRKMSLPIGLVRGQHSAVLDIDAHYAVAADVQNCIAIETISMAGHAIPFEQPAKLGHVIGSIVHRARQKACA